MHKLDGAVAIDVRVGELHAPRPRPDNVVLRDVRLLVVEKRPVLEYHLALIYHINIRIPSLKVELPPIDTEGSGVDDVNIPRVEMPNLRPDREDFTGALIPDDEVPGRIYIVRRR